MTETEPVYRCKVSWNFTRKQ